MSSGSFQPILISWRIWELLNTKKADAKYYPAEFRRVNCSKAKSWDRIFASLSSQFSRSIPLKEKIKLTMQHIRNFSIIAHIDHGKSTLADRLIQYAGLVTDRQFRDQILDNMDIERERGITIKSQTVLLSYTSRSGEVFGLNLIDTPGHVDFSYEVSRALASCEGVLLLVDASQGVQAQTIANLYAAMEHDLTIIPVINKIDLPSADIDSVKEQIEHDLGLEPDHAILCSAKEGTGIEDVLEAIVNRVPAPSGNAEKPLTALIFDAHYDSFRGTIVSCRVFDGTVRPGDTIRLMSNGATHKVEEVGVFRLHQGVSKRTFGGFRGVRDCRNKDRGRYQNR